MDGKEKKGRNDRWMMEGQTKGEKEKKGRKLKEGRKDRQTDDRRMDEKKERKE